jgi:predicted glycosyltransferase
MARPLTTLADKTWRILTGVNASAADAAMIGAAAAAAHEGEIIIERMRGDFDVLLENCTLSVSQAGYNTVMEIVQARARAVVVPFAGGAETEQLLRAAALAARGELELVEERELSPRTLAAAIDRAAAAPRSPRPDIDLEGAERSAALLAAWLASRG